VTGVERKTPEGAFHNVGYPAALIVPVPPLSGICPLIRPKLSINCLKSSLLILHVGMCF
jgi:hypothetical protein